MRYSRSLFTVLAWAVAAKAEDYYYNDNNYNDNGDYQGDAMEDDYNPNVDYAQDLSDASDYIQYWTEYAIMPKKCMV